MIHPGTKSSPTEISASDSINNIDIKYTMSVSKHRLLGGWYTRGLKVHQQKYRASDSIKNVDIKYTMSVPKNTDYWADDTLGD
jgi:hypothetical protein